MRDQTAQMLKQQIVKKVYTEYKKTGYQIRNNLLFQLRRQNQFVRYRMYKCEAPEATQIG